MENAEIEEVEDEIWEPCIKCGDKRLMAYWDDELESYIYFTEEAICTKCETFVKIAETA